MRIAAIDIGTNSVHMIVVRVRTDLSFEVIDREKAMVRLGAGGAPVVWGVHVERDNIVWSTDGDENIVWSTDGDENIVWSTGTAEQILWPKSRPRRNSGSGR